MATNTQEYFGKHAYYSRPDRLGELLIAIETAWRERVNPALASEIASHYLWSDVARQTAEVYDEFAG